MPEGDTIHKVAMALRPLLDGKTLSRGRLREYPEARFAGKTVSDIGVHGKHLFIEFDEREVLRCHLGMTGSWHRYAPGERWRRPSRQATVVLETDTDIVICFNASEVMVTRARGTRYKELRQRLGPDLLADPVDYDEILRRARLRSGQVPLLDLLLDQSIASGIGNVYKSELLFIHRLHPLTTLATVDDNKLTALYQDAADLLRRNLGDGRRTTRFPRDSAGRLWVYRRAGKPCLECDTPIEYRRNGRHRRSTYFCPHCQPED
ncbi:MAG: formamidopyrimidine DNA glycosylase [Gammaproteobacteria bacterium]|nr:formamidopyrimidine DNA glycosylase [Gammaproteobacteria bacterium]NND60062.1 Fpg/Nei family DNA glycosylase [Gammaproteobacteria bacterium]